MFQYDQDEQYTIQLVRRVRDAFDELYPSSLELYPEDDFDELTHAALIGDESAAQCLEGILHVLSKARPPRD